MILSLNIIVQLLNIEPSYVKNKLLGHTDTASFYTDQPDP